MAICPKAAADDFFGRFREVVSDPLNMLIYRHPRAGYVEDGLVYLHNGLRVPVSGKHSYYGEFSLILIINRGVHEPLEEFVFQELLKRLPRTPVMLELGAYWGHYSMWLKLARPDAIVHLIEPEATNLQCGRSNFELNGFTGIFEQAFVGISRFEVDQYVEREKLPKLEVLHADIQGYELEMLQGCRHTLSRAAVDYILVSTHSQELHDGTLEMLSALGYRVEVSADFDTGTTSHDGFVFASNISLPPLFHEFEPLLRTRLIEVPPTQLVHYLARVVDRASC
jgi:Methyltransferase FkbM domain